MEDKICEFIAWGLMATKWMVIGFVIVVSAQIIIYQGSHHKINPIRWLNRTLYKHFNMG